MRGKARKFPRFFPSIREVAYVLRGINANVEGECDVRLCIWLDGPWTVRYGLVDYDRSHSDLCGASCVPGVAGGKVRRFDSRCMASELLAQCADQFAEQGGLT